MLLFAVLFASAAAVPLVPADLIVHGGKVWRGKELPAAAALAVKDEKLVAVGTDEAVLAWRGPKTRVVDLKGRLVIPGFDDAHVHLLAGGRLFLSIDLRPSKDEADLAR